MPAIAAFGLLMFLLPTQMSFAQISSLGDDVRFAFGNIPSSGCGSSANYTACGGSGDFYVSHTGTGTYKITFKSGVFSGPPAVVANPGAYNRTVSIVPGTVTSSSVTIKIGRANGDERQDPGPYDINFHFVAAGLTENPRSDLAYVFGGVGGTTIRGSKNWSVSGSGPTYNLSFPGVFASTPTVVETSQNGVNCATGDVSVSGATIRSQWGGSGGSTVGCGYSAPPGDSIAFLAVGKSNSPTPFPLAVSEGFFNSSGVIQASSTGDFGVGSYGVNSTFGIGFFGFANIPVVVGSPIHYDTAYCGGYHGISTYWATLSISGGGTYTCTYGASGGVGFTMIAVALIPPEVDIYADAASVPLYTGTTIHWSSKYASTCSKIIITPSGGTPRYEWTVTPNTEGSHETGNLSVKTNYVISCTGPGGTASKFVDVSIDPPEIPMSADPSGVDLYGASVISWGRDAPEGYDIKNVVSPPNCTFSGNWPAGQLSAFHGTYNTGSLTTDKTYTITCTGPGGTTIETRQVTINPPDVPLSADPSAVDLYGTSTVSWGPIKNVMSPSNCTFSGDWPTGTSPSFSGTYNTGSLIDDQGYGIDCTGPTGKTQSSLARVSVNPITITIDASPKPVDYGTASVITWSSTEATACNVSFSVDGTNWTVFADGLSGSQSTGPLTANTTYSARCTRLLAAVGRGGRPERLVQKSASVEVRINTPTVSIWADDDRSAKSAVVPLNGSTIINWESDVNATACNVSSTIDGENWTTFASGTSGSQFTGNLTEDTTYEVVCSGPGGDATESFDVFVDRCPDTGTINVSSTNSVTGDYVMSTWEFQPFPSPLADPCAQGCTDLFYKEYANLPAANSVALAANCQYTLTATDDSAGQLFALKKIDNKFIAAAEDNSGFGWFKNLLLKIAKAVTVWPCEQGSNSCPQGLWPSSFGNVLFDIQWEPLAEIDVIPSSPILLPDCAAGSICLGEASAEQEGSVAVLNSGADGSQLDWSVDVSYSSGFSDWLTVSPHSSAAPVNVGDSQTVTVKYNVGSVPRGTQTSAALLFWGTTHALGDGTTYSPKVVTVNLSSSIPPVTLTPEQVNINVNTPTASFTVAGGMGTTYSCSVTGPSSPSCEVSGENTAFNINFPAVGTYTVTVTDSDPENTTNDKTDTATVTVEAPPASCDFSSSVGSSCVLPLATTTLNWECTNVDSAQGCTLNGTAVPVVGSLSVFPATTTVYTLNCAGVSGGADAIVPLRVCTRKPKIIEVPP